MYPYPAADLAPPALPAGLFSAESRNGPNQPKAFMCAGVDGPSPRIDLAPPQPLRTRGHYLRNPWISARRRPHWPSPPTVNSSSKNQTLEGDLRRVSSSNFWAITCLAILPIRSAVV